ncbi:MAG: HPF/RaiA family ribosome-associated protein [Lacunisphaera sp.]|nr:HPF/RaiA family ribosome-associated protein [Lacunisphaera sp.]
MNHTMQIQINTGPNIPGREALSAHVTSVVEHALSHFRELVTRVEVHLSDENGPKDGAGDMRCAMEARLEHHQPIAITHEAATLHQAIDGAADKLARLVGHTLGRQREERDRRTDPPPPGSELPGPA